MKEMKELNQPYIIYEVTFSKLPSITELYDVPIYFCIILCTLFILMLLVTPVVLFVSYIYHRIAVHIVLFVIKLNPIAILVFPFLVSTVFNLLNFTLSIMDYSDVLYMDDATGQSSNQSVSTTTTNTGQQSNTGNPAPNNRPISDLRYIILEEGTRYYFENRNGGVENRWTNSGTAAFVYDVANPQVRPHEFMYRSDSNRTTAVLEVRGVIYHGFVKVNVPNLNANSHDFGVNYQRFQQHAGIFNVVSRGNPVTVNSNGDITLRNG